jgi:ectoine hydroxylase-related dioxygenase (phytanoyl-CoA dioxygenase family)
MDRVGAIRRSVADTVEKHSNKESLKKGVGFVPGVIAQNQEFAPYLAHPKLMRIANSLLGEHVRISFTSAIVNNPGNVRGEWHADWPYNQNNAGHMKAPYPDVVSHLTTLWMLSGFSRENGGTLIQPGSHKSDNNPTGDNGISPDEVLPGELQATGSEGDVLVMDSRLWHASAVNMTTDPRIALAIRYAPWWLNTDVLMPGSNERARLVDEPGATDNVVPPVPKDVFENLPDDVKPLYRHWVHGMVG